MRILHDIKLSEKTTFRVGGAAHNFYIPENTDEVIDVLSRLRGKDLRVLSGGSNLLINDKHSFDNIIFCGEFDKDLIDIGGGVFYIGASNRIQKVIKFVNEKGYGGFEELIGLPAMFGGIIYMNAGIGGRNGIYNISDFVRRVKCVDRTTCKIIWLQREDCQFAYRKSVFKDNNYIILGAELQLGKQDIGVSEERISKRREYIKNHQEWGKGCFGSCFMNYSRRILRMTDYLSRFDRGGVHQSHMNSNWLVNNGKGTFDDAMRIINRAIRLHRIFHVAIEQEVIIWK